MNSIGTCGASRQIAPAARTACGGASAAMRSFSFLRLGGMKKLWVANTPDGKTLNHNCVQVVGEREAGPRPHTDSRALCRYAGVLYLTPDAPEHCGHCARGPTRTMPGT